MTTEINQQDPRVRAQSIRTARALRVRRIRRRVVGGSVALFLAAWLLIAAVLVSGHDPALSKTTSVAAVSSSSDSSGSTGSGSSGSSSSLDSGSSSGAGTTSGSSSGSGSTSGSSSGSGVTSVTTRQS
jgi:hypothetical protein